VQDEHRGFANLCDGKHGKAKGMPGAKHKMSATQKEMTVGQDSHDQFDRVPLSVTR
jgi:hypothetical protein